MKKLDGNTGRIPQPGLPKTRLPRSPVERETARPPTPPLGKPTTDADRQRLANPISAHGSEVAAALIAKTATGVDTSSLGALAKPLKQAVSSMTGPRREEAIHGLRCLANAKAGPRLAVALMTNTSPNKLKPRDIELFTTATISPADIATKLADKGRRHEISQVLAGMHGSLRNLLTDALTGELDPARVKGALAWIDRALEQSGDSVGISTLLIDAGCLPHNWPDATEIAPGSDPLGVILEHAKTFGDAPIVMRPAELDARLARFRDVGITDDPAWTKTTALDNHRGLIGEELRLQQIADDPADAGRLVVQGVFVVSSPPGLAACTNSEQAKAFCEANGLNAGRVMAWDEGDVHRYGFRITEIDVVVIEQTADGIRPIRFENVKSGNSSASTARKQNQKAVDGLADPNVKFLFPVADGGVVDRSAELDRSAIVDTLTVGPAGDMNYDTQLPLSSGDITELTKRLEALP